MEQPTVAQSPPLQRVVWSETTVDQPAQEMRVASADAKLHKLQRLGIRVLLLGLSPETFVEKPTIQVILLWAFLGVFYFACTSFEIVSSALFSRNLLEMVAHAYIATYVGSFTFQWGYFFRIIPKMYTDRILLEDFQCAKSQPESTERIVKENLKFLKKVLIFAGWWLAMNTAAHILGPIIEASLTLLRGGEVHEIFLLPQVFQLPMWGQIIMYLWNTGTTFGLWWYCTFSYTALGVQVAKIKILCEILNEALVHAPDNRNIRDYIEDHVKIIKRAKELNDQLGSLNSWVITAGYLEFATQMFVMTVFDLNMSYYIAVSFDMMSIFLIVTLQCFMASQITDSLESIADGPYKSEWYEMEKGLSKHIILMTQMAQNTFPQTIWFGSLKIERATTLNLLRSSYAAYTALMIFQK